MLRVLCLEPWLGGSHALFLEQWRARSRHAVEVEGLAPRRWKWRMTAGAWELARRLAGRQAPDVWLASDYVDLPALRGFLPPEHAARPALVYMHENQLGYPHDPARGPDPRDLHHGFTNVLSCVAAERVVFNSAYHRAAFAAAADALLSRLPRPNPRAELAARLADAAVVAPGVDLDALAPGPGAPPDAPLRVVFNHRLEHDKDPLAFLDALLAARARGAALELVLLGERYVKAPAGVAERLAALGGALVHEGFAPTRAEYAALLGTADVVVSTARHEFFGLATAEALAAGCAPLLPDRLAYPELLPEELRADGLYTDDADLVERLVALARDPRGLRTSGARQAARAAAARFSADETARALDALCAALAP